MGNTSDAFKEKLQGNNIKDALMMALSEAIELKITTWVSDVNDPKTDEEPKPGYRMQTRINIVDGDIQNEVGSLFLSQGPYAELREFHLDQVKEGRQIIQKNIESLQQLFGLLAAVLPKAIDVPSSSSNRALPPSQQ
jgi:hypothetical protein